MKYFQVIYHYTSRVYFFFNIVHSFKLIETSRDISEKFLYGCTEHFRSAKFNFAYFQLFAAISQNENPSSIGLGVGSPLNNSLKQRVVTLASNTGVLATIQQAAQAVLQNGWSLLLPTPEERAKALSFLLPSSMTTGNTIFSKSSIKFAWSNIPYYP